MEETEPSKAMQEAIETGVLELILDAEGKAVLLTVPHRLSVEEEKCFMTRAEEVDFRGFIFEKTHESKYFPTMNGIEAEKQVIGITYKLKDD